MVLCEIGRSWARRVFEQNLGSVTLNFPCGMPYFHYFEQKLTLFSAKTSLKLTGAKVQFHRFANESSLSFLEECLH